MFLFARLRFSTARLRYATINAAAAAAAAATAALLLSGSPDFHRLTARFLIYARVSPNLFYISHCLAARALG